MQMPPKSQGLGPTGRRWVGGIILSLGVVVAVNMLMLNLALDSHPETSESYKNEENRK